VQPLNLDSAAAKNKQVGLLRPIPSGKSLILYLDEVVLTFWTGLQRF